MPLAPAFVSERARPARGCAQAPPTSSQLYAMVYSVIENERVFPETVLPEDIAIVVARTVVTVGREHKRIDAKTAAMRACPCANASAAGKDDQEHQRKHPAAPLL